MEAAPPECLEIRSGVLPLPVALDDRVAGGIWLVGKRGQYFVHRMPVGQRSDERLQDRDATVKRAHVAPALERVERGNVPVARGGRLVLEKSEVYPRLDLVQPRCKRDVDRSGVRG